MDFKRGTEDEEYLIEPNRQGICLLYIRKKEKMVLTGKYSGRHEPKPQQQQRLSRNIENNLCTKSETRGKLGTLK